MTEKDWIAVVSDTTCDECGLRAAGVRREDLRGALRGEARLWAALLLHDRAALTNRPMPGWSALEYSAHVRDVLREFGDRVARTLREDEPAFGWWDHEATARDEAYNEQDPEAVGRAIQDNAEHLAALTENLRGSAWERRATRRADEHFSTEGLIRFALHEMRHHRTDAQRRIDVTLSVR